MKQNYMIWHNDVVSCMIDDQSDQNDPNRPQPLKTLKDLKTWPFSTPPLPPTPPPITKVTPHLHPKFVHFFRPSTTQNSSFFAFHLMPPIPIPPPPPPQHPPPPSRLPPNPRDRMDTIVDFIIGSSCIIMIYRIISKSMSSLLIHIHPIIHLQEL